MKVLYIGGTGNISAASSRLALKQGIELFHLNRGITKANTPDGIHSIIGDINNSSEIKRLLKGLHFDVVVNWIAFTPEDIKRDYELFAKHTNQYIFISSASAYQKPQTHHIITESTPLVNPFWDYSRHKIACEDLLMSYHRNNGFPVTIVRPSHTYDTVIPVAIGGWKDYTIIDRLKKGKPIIIHGDGSSLWTITHAEDFAKGFNGLLGHQQAIGHAFHITSDEILNWNQIYQTVADAVGVPLNAVHIASDFICKIANDIGRESMEGSLHGDKAVSAIFDNSKIKRFVPDYMATIPFNKGIKNTLKWFHADKDRMQINRTNDAFIDTVIKAYKQNH